MQTKFFISNLNFFVFANLIIMCVTVNLALNTRETDENGNMRKLI